MFDAVEADFKANDVDAPMFFGWREPAKHKRSHWRLVWVPGDSGNSLGTLAPPRSPGNNPRTLGTLKELVTVRIEAYDHQAAENERSQYKAARCLFDLWYAAVYRAAYGKFEVLSTDWDTSQNERRFGAAIVAVVSVEATLPDITHDVAPFDTEGDITTELDDVSEKTLTPSP